MYEYRQMLCLSILRRHGKVWHRREINKSRAEPQNVDIYAARTGKEQFLKDPLISQSGPDGVSIFGNTHTVTQQVIGTNER